MTCLIGRGVRGLTVSNVMTEYGQHGTGEDMVTVRGYAEDLVLDQVYPADSHDGVVLLNNTGDIYGCRIKGRSYQSVKGNHIHGLVWETCSAAPFHGLSLPGSGSINGMTFGPHEDDGIRHINTVVPHEWEIPLTIPVPMTHRGADLTADSAFEVAAASEIQLGFPGIRLEVGDAIVAKVFAKVRDGQNLDGGEMIVGFQNATIQNGNGGEATYVVNSFRGWPIPSGGDVRQGGHWRELIVVAVIQSVAGDIQYLNWNLRGRTNTTRFWNPRWWRIPVSEYSGLEDLLQLARHRLQ